MVRRRGETYDGVERAVDSNAPKETGRNARVSSEGTSQKARVDYIARAVSTLSRLGSPSARPRAAKLSSRTGFDERLVRRNLRITAAQRAMQRVIWLFLPGDERRFRAAR